MTHGQIYSGTRNIVTPVFKALRASQLKKKMKKKNTPNINPILFRKPRRLAYLENFLIQGKFLFLLSC